MQKEASGHLHVLGVSGTFMSALALFARKLGFKVTGSDANCYPPVSDLLAAEGITWTEGYTDTTDALAADCVVVGNAIMRGMPVIEAVLDADKPYISGPQWLAENVLSRYRVLAVAGTHGKTTTTSMLTFILDQAGLAPGFLIGGVASNFQTNARLGDGEWFVIEADEYDSAFFDKRPKFMHYHPECAIFNNLEFDHADIYADLAAIQKQVHYFLKTIPPKGELLYPRDDVALKEVMDKGVFSHASSMASQGDAVWRVAILDDIGSHFHILHQNKVVAEIKWDLMGQFNAENGLAAFAASMYAGVEPEVAARALEQFVPVKRRLEVRMDAYGIKLYDDFAHHPTAIEKTIKAVKQQERYQRVLVILELASHSMRMGVHGTRIADALANADDVYVLTETPSDAWPKAWTVSDAKEPLVKAASAAAQAGDALVVMSNRSLEAVHQGLITAFDARFG
ncbi:MAG: UDP-N-acetylmuramate:L-alanyl-gamma-D-glutamyl-meso-diaminopimelate ligase [Gammaproteobacteria bacterium]|nr:UDP-N-acetylmuramate:L-alanyl-gamma-D-glutamyl-meso-diaminopimelate ligase [Gammaproteobacteria bacterium]